jgi:hypothetical protein
MVQPRQKVFKIMNSVPITVTNWPSADVGTIATVFIALISLAVALYSANLSRNTAILASRPYVWAANYVVISDAKNTLVPRPDMLMLRVYNSPANIIRQCVNFYIGDDHILGHCDENFVRFPDDKSEWTFSLGTKDFRELFNRQNPENIERHVEVSFKAIGGSITYTYSLKQRFNPPDNQWVSFEELTK